VDHVAAFHLQLNLSYQKGAISVVLLHYSL